MSKWMLVIIISMGIFFFVQGYSHPKYDGVLLKETEIYKALTLKNAHLLSNIIVLPNDTYDINEVKEVIHRIDFLPTRLLRDIRIRNIKIVLFNGSLTDNESAAHLKGEKPKGWPSPFTWDDVPGIGGSKIVLVKIGHSDKGEGHGSVNLEFHELAHSVYNYILDNQNDYEDIHALWKGESQKVFPDNSYLINYEEEYFAEAFAHFYYDKETRKLLKVKAPKTYSFFSQLQ